MSGTVLVYGGAGGIGEATARRLKARGFALHLASRDEGKLARAAGELGAGFTVADVTDAGSFARVTEAAAQGGALRGLVYAVGTINLKPATRLTADDFLNDFRVNALGAALALQAATRALKASEETSSVVLFSTVAVAQGFSAHASIGMAKGAVEGLAVSMAAELAPKVRVNVIAPSLTRTPLARVLTDSPKMAEGIAEMHALPRLGEPDDIAPLAALLISDEAGWITGQVIGVDGGRARLRTKG